MKKIRGKIHYFGRWGRVVDGSMQRIEGDGWKEALEEYKVQADDLHAGRTPRLASDGLTVADLCNRFLTAKTRKLEAGEIGRRMFADYREITDLVVVNLGKNQPVNGLAAEDFAALRVAMAKRWGPVRLDVSITRIKSVFKFAFDNALIDRPIRYGAEFAKPSRAVLRKHRAQSGPKMLEADQLRRLLAHLEANHALRAMVLLGLNAGFGNTDVASLPLKALDLAGGWVCYPRPKTGVARRCPLWPETVAALKVVIAARPAVESDTVFVNSRGSPWLTTTETSRRDNIAVHFAAALKAVGIHQSGTGFYALRHVFRTVADAARDNVAIDRIMGHTDDSMGERYRERVDDARLLAVTDLVHDWLWPSNSNNTTGGR